MLSVYDPIGIGVTCWPIHALDFSSFWKKVIGGGLIPLSPLAFAARMRR
jgi:hypothetical protein